MLDNAADSTVKQQKYPYRGVYPAGHADDWPGFICLATDSPI
jgi:hypothetical protein